MNGLPLCLWLIGGWDDLSDCDASGLCPCAYTQLQLCIPDSGDDEARGTVLCQNLDSKKELLFCEKKKKKEAGLFLRNSLYWFAGRFMELCQLFIQRFWVCNKNKMKQLTHAKGCSIIYRL